MSGVGDAFRAARESRNLSLSEAGETIRIRSVYLENIERDEWSALGAPVYARGFIRAYAKSLDVDPEPALAAFGAQTGASAHQPFGAPPPDRVRQSSAAAPRPAPAPEPREQRPPKAAPPPRAVRTSGAAQRPGVSPWLAVLAGIALVLLGYVGYEAYELRGRPAQVAQVAPSPSPAPSAAATARPVPKPARDLAQTLQLRLTQASWLLVSIDGTERLQGVYPAGTLKAFKGKTAEIRAGNAGGVDVTVDGKHVGPMGAAGDVVSRTIVLAQE